MQPWQPGICLLSALDMKIGRLFFTARKQQMIQQDIAAACEAADQAIERLSEITRQGHERRSRHHHLRRND